jgi:hypothetical protein
VNALTPFMAAVPPPFSFHNTVAYVLQQFDVPKDITDRILDNTAEQQAAAQAQLQQLLSSATSGPSGPSGPGGDNAPTGLSGGAPTAVGPMNG